jgi:hypothetical protein
MSFQTSLLSQSMAVASRYRIASAPRSVGLRLIVCSTRHVIRERYATLAARAPSAVWLNALLQVRCDAASLGVPCTNCVAFSIECKIPAPKRKKGHGKSKDSDRSVHSSGRPQAVRTAWLTCDAFQRKRDFSTWELAFPRFPHDLQRTASQHSAVQLGGWHATDHPFRCSDCAAGQE